MLINLSFLLLTAAATMQGQSAACMSVEEARQIAQAENIMPLQDAVRHARAHKQGDLVAAKLCRVNQRMMYVLTMMTIDRHVVRLAVDAHTGAVQEIR